MSQNWNMDTKYLNVIEQFTKDDLRHFLQKHGSGEFEDILFTREITTGESFLNLTELQMTKWALPIATRRKLLSFVTEIKQNPQKFVDNAQVKKLTSLNRRQSVRNYTDFGKILAPIISNSRVKPAILPKQENKTDPNQYPLKQHVDNISDYIFEKYLPMDQLNSNKQATEPNEDYYLTPIGQSKDADDAYEVPSESITSVQPRVTKPCPISARPPLALPRESADYITPDSLPDALPPPVFSRPQKNDVPTVSTPLLLRRDLPDTYNDDEDEIVDYEPVDDEPGNYSFKLSSSPSSSSISGKNSITKFTSFFIKGGRKTEDPLKNDTDKNKVSTNFSSLPRNIPSSSRKLSTARPLPPLPIELAPKIENLDLGKRGLRNTEISKSSPDIVDEAPKTPITDEEIAKAPSSLSYEKYKINNRPLPVPPANIPQIVVNSEAQADVATSSDDDVVYEQFLFNVNDEPFYRNTDRKGAKMLLFELEDGAFLFRPSKKFFLTLSLKFNNQYFNLGIEQTGNRKIRLNTDDNNMSPEFSTLSEIVEYFTREQLAFEHQGQVIELLLTKTLPHNKF